MSLRPGTGRRGPAELWARFDRAVASLNTAITGSSAAAVADAFGELSEAAAVPRRGDRPRGPRRLPEDRAASEDRAPAARTAPPPAKTQHPSADQQARSRGIA